ncbi:MAG: GGDEF domain-containing protein [Candidatus Gracilibacteria bacterium]
MSEHSGQQPGHLLRQIKEGTADERFEFGLKYEDPTAALRVAGIDPEKHHAAVQRILEALPGDPDVEMLIEHFGAMGRAVVEERKQNNEDSLTGAKSRRWFFKRLHGLQAKARKEEEKRPFSLIMIDIDFFKKINDKYGHQAGDYVLQQLVGLIKGALREGDEIARYGGEEFVIISMAKNGEASGLAHRIRALIETTPLEIRYSQREEKQVNITISMGVASFYPHKDEEDMAVVTRADVALYAAKGAGRNTVKVADEGEDDSSNVIVVEPYEPVEAKEPDPRASSRPEKSSL